MARVRPFAGIRYVRPESDITPVTAPPYDVISPAQREALLAEDSYNVVALELPDGPLDPGEPGNRYERGAAAWHAWQRAGVVAADAAPSIYVLEQHFAHAGKQVRRRALIVEVALEPFEAGIVLPHERTLPKALDDRFELIKATHANFSQVLGLFDDSSAETDVVFDAIATGEPLERATDADGVESLLWATSDLTLVESVVRILADKRIFIADGHHRYTTALAYRDICRKAATARGDAPLDPACDFVMMALVNMEDPELVVMPTHRVADVEGVFDPAAFYAALGRYFVVEDLPPGHPSAALDAIAEPAYLVKTSADDRPRLVRLRDDVDLDAAIRLSRSSAWKHLDVAVLQELILDPILDIHPDRSETLDRLSFVKDAHDALKATDEHDVVFVLRPTRMDQLRAVALAGETMPQKSTYFYPKLLSGLLFRSTD